MDENIEKKIKRVKAVNYIVFGAFVALAVLVLIFAAVYAYQHDFTTEKWIENPSERVEIVDDLLEEYDLMGYGREELELLLGENDNDLGYFVRGDVSVYYLGPERGLLSIDSEWLVIEFEDGKVSGYEVKID